MEKTIIYDKFVPDKSPTTPAAMARQKIKIKDIAQMADRIVHIEDGRIVGSEREAVGAAREAGEGDA